MQFKVGSIYYIEWDDHWSGSGWHYDIGDLMPITVFSIGYFVAEFKNMIRLSGNKSPNGGFIGSINIIKSCIKNVYELNGIE